MKKWRNKVLYKWRKPRAVQNAEFVKEMCDLRRVLLRCLLLAILVALVFWLLVQLLFPELEVPLAMPAQALLVVGFLFGLNFFVVWGVPCEYRLTEDGISWMVGQHLYRMCWKDVEQAASDVHPLLPDLPVIKLHLNNGRIHTIVLPTSADGPQIAEAIAKRVPALVNRSNLTP